MLVVSQWYKPEILGTAPYVSDMSEWFVEKGYNVQVLTQRPTYPSKKAFLEYEAGANDEETIQGVAIKRVNSLEIKRGNLIDRIKSESMFFFLGGLQLLTGKVKRSNFTISFCPSILTVLLGSLFTKKNGIHLAVIHDIQSGLAESLGMSGKLPLPHLIRFLEKIILNSANRIIVLTSEMESVLKKNGVRKPINIIPLWVDFSKIFPIHRPLQEQVSLLYSGNLGRKQGLKQIVGLAEQLQKQGINAIITIRGEGSQKQELKNTIQEKDIRNVIFSNSSKPEDFNVALSRGDIHIVTQVEKTSGYAIPSKIYSILAAGKPLICLTQKGGMLDLISNESGAFITVQQNSPKLFAKAVIDIISDDALRDKLSKSGLEYVKNNNSRENILNTYHGLLYD